MKTEAILQKTIDFISHGFNLAAKSFGFHDWDSMSGYVFLIVNKTVTVSLLVISLTISINGWIESWIFSPFYTYAVFIALMLAEVFFGTLKAIKVDKEKFNWDKFGRLVPKFLAHTFALSAAYHMSKAEPLLVWMPSTVFIYFSVQNFMKSAMHLVDLKGLEGGFTDFMRQKFSQNNDFIPTKNENKPSGDQDPT